MFRVNELIGQYVLVKPLGNGATGEVWLAERRGAIATTQVAIKLFSREERVDRRSIRKEATLWVKAGSHKNILSIVDADLHEDQMFIVSEYVPGGSLENWLRCNGGVSPSVHMTVHLVTDILKGLQHLHEQKIIHRDLKPDNILLKNDTPVITDFGLSKFLKSSKTLSISGTSLYMSPEAHNGDYSEQTDVWSVGVILYRLIVGKLPFAHVGSISNGEVGVDLLEVPEIFQPIILLSLSKDVKSRFLSASDMLMAVSDIKNDIVTRTPTDSLVLSSESNGDNTFNEGYLLDNVNKKISSISYEELTRARNILESSITRIMFNDRQQCQGLIKQNLLVKDVIFWLLSLEILLKRYKWSRTIPFEILWPQFKVVYYSRVNREIPYETILNLYALFTHIPREEHQSFAETLLLKLKPIINIEPTPDITDDIPF